VERIQREGWAELAAEEMVGKAQQEKTRPAMVAAVAGRTETTQAETDLMEW
jgi:hypothetical protein